LRPRRLWPVLAATAAIAAVVGVAWALQSSVSDGGETPKGGSPPAYSIKVEQGGAVLKEYDLAALHALPQASAEIDGKEQSGPLLATVLADAGAPRSRTVEVRGAGLRDPGRLTLTAAQVARDVQLDFSDRGTVKVCSAWLERREWVRDVLTISAD
jgi:hypothetical protein